MVLDAFWGGFFLLWGFWGVLGAGGGEVVWFGGGVEVELG